MILKDGGIAMVPKNTPLCTTCGQHRTTHESGICSICRKRKNFRPCIRCGERKAQAADGICSVCRTSLKNQKNSWLTEDQAIERMEQLLAILQWHRKGASYTQISEMLCIPRSTAYLMAMRARNMKPTALEVADPDAELEDKLLGEKRGNCAKRRK